MSDQTDPAFLQGGYPGVSKKFIHFGLYYTYNNSQIVLFFPYFMFYFSSKSPKNPLILSYFGTFCIFSVYNNCIQWKNRTICSLVTKLYFLVTTTKYYRYAISWKSPTYKIVCFKPDLYLYIYTLLGQIQPIFEPKKP